MSLLMADCCGDIYTTAELVERWDTVGGVPTVVAGAGRRGSGGIQLSGVTALLERNVTSAATYIVGVAAKLTSVVATDLLTLYEGGTPHIIVRITALGEVEVLRAASTSLGKSAVGLIAAGFFNYIEIKVTIHDTTGTVDLHVNGTNRVSLTSQDTRNGGASGEISIVQVQGSTGVLTIDDFYIGDTAGSAPQNDFLGDIRIDATLPSSDGTTTDWEVVTPASPASYFDKVDDATPDRETTLVASSTSDEIVLFHFPPQPDVGGVSSIFGVQLSMFLNKDNEGGRQIQAVARPDATNRKGASQNVLESWNYYYEMWQLNPDSAAVWSEAEVESSEFGVIVV